VCQPTYHGDSMTMCRSRSQDDDSTMIDYCMTMCLSRTHDDDSMIIVYLEEHRISRVCRLSCGPATQALWRTKKSHFRPSDEMSMKKVDKDVVNTK
jgi:hypothetical protein